MAASSPERRSFSGQIHNLGQKLSRMVSHDGTAETEHTTTTTAADRSLSRGRDAVAYSSGRGGAGNIHRSASRGVDEEAAGILPRGRETTPNPNKAMVMGRGGAGNYRSPSRDPVTERDQFEKDVLARAAVETNDQHFIHSTGRGGAGNITGDRSRSRSRGPAAATAVGGVGAGGVAQAHHSVGRGGFGNIALGDGSVAEKIDEEERREHDHAHDHAAPHSTGRGGFANVATGVPPAVDQPTHRVGDADYVSSGRGGAGNIHHPNAQT